MQEPKVYTPKPGEQIDPRARFLTTWWSRTERMSDADADGFRHPIYEMTHRGDVSVAPNVFRLTMLQMPVGALTIIPRYEDRGPDQIPYVAPHDGLAISCKMWDHTWWIENTASNCDKKEERTHRCWVRHGTVGELLTVDKKGNTCGAGAGSVYMDGNRWHGFLRNGILEP